MKYYGLTEQSEIVELGDFENFCGAADEADDVCGIVWILDQSDVERVALSLKRLNPIGS